MIKLIEVTSIEQLKELERPTVDSIFQGWAYTVNVPLIAIHKRKGIILIDKWFINNNNELIYSDNNDYFNLEMYLGITTPSSWVSDLYVVEHEEKEKLRMKHTKKIHKKYFEEVISGNKTFEIRNEYDYRYFPGDIIVLEEIDEGVGSTFTGPVKTGRNQLVEVTYRLDSKEFPEGIKPGYIVLGIKLRSDEE